MNRTLYEVVLISLFGAACGFLAYTFLQWRAGRVEIRTVRQRLYVTYFIAVISTVVVIVLRRTPPFPGIPPTPSPEVTATPEPFVLSAAILEPPASLDPALATDWNSGVLVTQLFEGLLRTDESGVLRPGAATSWDVSEDGLTWTFHVREDARWSDGAMVTAQDFELAIKRILDPALGSPLAYQLYVIAGAEEFNEGQLLDPDSVGVRTPDDYTLEIQLVRPYPVFLATVGQIPPVPHYLVEEYGDEWASPQLIQTNGPFMLASWEDDSIRLVPNSEYYDVLPVFYEGIELEVIRDLAEAQSALEAGEVDGVMTASFTEFSPYVKGLTSSPTGFPDLVHAYLVARE